ncbi:hypothetical protein DFH28DRAFT_923223 [Melampsora americana]|nr:hypothetical protein DFH28DRAFT_923223 [Melampsora americana]
MKEKWPLERRERAGIRRSRVQFVHRAHSIGRSPQSVLGVPPLYIEDEGRQPYNYKKGYSYLTEEERVKYIEQSQALEKSLKDNSDEAFREEAWDYPIPQEGLDVPRDNIDKEDYAAIYVSTSTALLTHLIMEKPKTARKVGVTMASLWLYALNEDGVIYLYTYNLGINLTTMNSLLK